MIRSVDVATIMTFEKRLDNGQNDSCVRFLIYLLTQQMLLAAKETK